MAIKEKAVSKFAKNEPPNTCNGVFIRAPGIVAINSAAVTTLATVHIEGADVIVGVQDKNCIGLAFHPELTEDIRWHAYFLNMITERK